VRSFLRPRLQFWLISVCALAAVLVALGLGRWQLSRADQKQALQERLVQQSRKPPLDLARVINGQGKGELVPPLASATLPAAKTGNAPTAPADLPAEGLIDQPVIVQGRWLPRFTVYLDNRQMNGRQGFFVMTPFQVEDTRRVVLVQRGWAPRDFIDRARLPVVDTPASRVTLSGRIMRSPGRLFEFATGGQDVAAGAPAEVASGVVSAGISSPVRQNIDISAFRAETRLPLWDLMLLETGSASDGLKRDWLEPRFGTEKHHGYAFQWFGIGVLIAVLYVWFQLVPRFRANRPRR
jgi:surfeit locus 1 family protein